MSKELTMTIRGYTEAKTTAAAARYVNAGWKQKGKPADDGTAARPWSVTLVKKDG